MVEIIAGVERRRHWRPEEKLRILAELGEPGAQFVDVAPRHEVSCGLLWQWRDAQRRGTLVAEETTFMLVCVVPDLPAPASPAGPAAASPCADPAVERDDRIEIVLPDGTARSPAHVLPADQRQAVRQQQIAPLVVGLETSMREQRARMSRHAEMARAMDYMLTRWDAFNRFLHDGRICLTNNAAERQLRGVALGRKAWMFAGSDRGGERAAAKYSLIATARLNDVDPRAGSPTCWHASPTTRRRACMSCCPGTGSQRRPTPPPRPLERNVSWHPQSSWLSASIMKSGTKQTRTLLA